MLNQASIGTDSFCNNALKHKYIEDSRFDPMGFFFLTYRSQAIGLTLALRKSETEYEIPFLVCVPKHKEKGVEEALLSLILTYCQ